VARSGFQKVAAFDMRPQFAFSRTGYRLLGQSRERSSRGGTQIVEKRAADTVSGDHKRPQLFERAALLTL
jgi:hypothetical protein